MIKTIPLSIRIKNFVIVFLLGITVIGGQTSVSLERYCSMLTMAPIRYILLILALYYNFNIFKNVNRNIILIRMKSLFNFLMKSILHQIIELGILIFQMHIPILIFIRNIEEIKFIVLNIISIVIILSLFTSIISFISIWIKNNMLCYICFMSFYSIIDFVLRHFSFEYNNRLFLFISDIFVLPAYFKDKIYIFLIIILLLTIILMVVSSYFMAKRDYVVKYE